MKHCIRTYLILFILSHFAELCNMSVTNEQRNHIHFIYIIFMSNIVIQIWYTWKYIKVECGDASSEFFF